MSDLTYMQKLVKDRLLKAPVRDRDFHGFQRMALNSLKEKDLVRPFEDRFGEIWYEILGGIRAKFHTDKLHDDLENSRLSQEQEDAVAEAVFGIPKPIPWSEGRRALCAHKIVNDGGGLKLERVPFELGE